MCGIAGILMRQPGRSDAPIGATLLKMALSLQHRGRDSAGFALFSGSVGANSLRLQAVLPEGAPLPEPQAVIEASAGLLADLRPEKGGFSAAVREPLPEGMRIDTLVAALESNLPGVSVSAVGRVMRVYKSVGVVDALAEEVCGITGSHGIAHLRLATESRIDPCHAQPFWGRPFPDVSVTHNGHITNYYKLRRRMQEKGYRFASENDSEIIGVLIGEKLEAGADLGGAVEELSGELDGSFSFIAAAPGGIAVGRDPIATKPLLFVETDECVALASEPQALRRVVGDTARIREIRPKETRAWEIA